MPGVVAFPRNPLSNDGSEENNLSHSDEKFGVEIETEHCIFLYGDRDKKFTTTNHPHFFWITPYP